MSISPAVILLVSSPLIRGQGCSVKVAVEDVSTWLPQPRLASCEELEIKGAPIGSDGALKLSAVLRRSLGLRILRLDGLDLRDEGVQAVAKALDGLPSLVELHLARNRIGSSGITSLAVLLSSPRSQLQACPPGCFVL